MADDPPKDVLRAASTAILKPGLADAGFVRLGLRNFVRVDDVVIAQFINPQVSAWGGKRFCLNYAVTCLCYPFEGWTLTWGDRLRKPSNRAELWWEAATQPRADAAAREVLELLQQQAFPFFERTRTADGFLTMLAERPDASDPHRYFEQGCCEAWAGRVDQAKPTLEVAVRLYRETPYDWADSYRRRADELRDAINARTHRQVLQSWASQRCRMLRLDQLPASKRPTICQ